MEASTGDHCIRENQRSKLPNDNFYTPENLEFYDSGQYQHLDRIEQEIRLFQILPSGDPTKINVRLVNTRLQSPDGIFKRYNAISYFAGKHTNTQTIRVNGIPFNAFANLVHAIRQIQSLIQQSDRDLYQRLFWADQICINQSDKEERSHQVSFMRDIYEHADVVLVDLGPSDDKNWINAARYLHLTNSSSMKLDLTNETITFDGHKQTSLHDDRFQQNWRSLRALLRSPWWQRGWVHQEVIVAQKVLVIYGVGIMNWNFLSTAIEVVLTVVTSLILQLMSHEGPQEVNKAICQFLGGDDNFIYAKFMIAHQRTWQQCRQRRGDIIQFLCHAMRCEVADRRDRIYAFTRLADPDYSITPDYTATLPCVIRDTCKRIIWFDKNLNSLTYCTPTCVDIPEQKDTPKREEIPSWCSDWSAYRNVDFNFIYDANGGRPDFEASLHYTSAVAFHPRGNDADAILEVQCLFIDQLATEGSLSPPHEATEKQHFETWERLANPAGDMKHNRYPFEDTGTVNDAFWEVLTRGRVRFNKDDLRYVAELLSETMEFGRFFRSPIGYLGVTKNIADLRHTDSICVLLGANVPFILRKVGDHFILVGDAYVQGLMYGEAIKLMGQGILEVKTIRIH